MSNKARIKRYSLAKFLKMATDPQSNLVLLFGLIKSKEDLDKAVGLLRDAENLFLVKKTHGFSIGAKIFCNIWPLKVKDKKKAFSVPILNFMEEVADDWDWYEIVADGTKDEIEWLSQFVNKDFVWIMYGMFRDELDRWHLCYKRSEKY